MFEMVVFLGSEVTFLRFCVNGCRAMESGIARPREEAANIRKLFKRVLQASQKIGWFLSTLTHYRCPFFCLLQSDLNLLVLINCNPLARLRGSICLSLALLDFLRFIRHGCWWLGILKR